MESGNHNTLNYIGYCIHIPYFQLSDFKIIFKSFTDSIIRLLSMTIWFRPYAAVSLIFWFERSHFPITFRQLTSNSLNKRDSILSEVIR